MTASEEVGNAKVPMVVQSLTGLKHLLYLILAFFSFLLFILSCVVATYEKDTYGGYNPPLGLLAFVGAWGTLFLPILVWSQKVRPETITNSYAAELGVCGFLWLFILSGVGALTSQTYDLLACQNLFICRGFSTIMAFSWISWIILTVMLGFKLYILANLWSRRLPIDYKAPTKAAYQTMKTGVAPEEPQKEEKAV
ncbi:hypothetical protein BY996DRAFT_6410355 [Phakopsora pachyrhizi]|uniref:MARVEL domain-containing protein n=1 Tax=Phakopsora pachyrhizi TaxID=170000 RepID=A0AAV0BL06_PHAPC|nr:hypothetical protein BY996DRAFT_6410355 [Phakopsora pachyrhizi]CAH7687303.1 hypothetical protein PPACK8108_LOCUS22071 [Phakopsora pachyrhizi]